MSVPLIPYGPWLMAQIKNTTPVDFDADTFAMVLLGASGAPDRDADEFADDLVDELTTGGGYTAGGQELTGVAVTWDSTLHAVVIDANDPLWTTATFSTRYAVLKKVTGNPATERLVAYVDFGSTQSPAGVDFGLEFPAAAAGGAIKVG